MAGTGSGRLKKYPWPNSQFRLPQLVRLLPVLDSLRHGAKPGRMDQLQDGRDKLLLPAVRRQVVDE